MRTLLLMSDWMRTSISPPGHPTSERVAAFLDGHVNATERDVLLAHFASCDDCRREMVELRSALRSTGRPAATASRTSTWLTAVAAIAAIILVMTRMPGITNNSLEPAPLDSGLLARQRAAPGAAGNERAVITVVSPRDAGELRRQTPTLTWRASGADAMYLVTVQDSIGNVVWSGSVQDTIITLPNTAALAVNARYFWSVDGRRADGETTRSGVHTFVVH